jgi:hypothetical protein
MTISFDSTLDPQQTVADAAEPGGMTAPDPACCSAGRDDDL